MRTTILPRMAAVAAAVLVSVTGLTGVANAWAGENAGAGENAWAGETASIEAAAYPHCNGSKAVRKGSYATTQPYYTATGSRNCQLTRGDSGSGVRALQSAMNACYGTGLVTDGVFGENTEEAVKKVQIAVGAEVDGYYGPETRDAMRWPLTGGGGCSRI